jgi:hypothetical protein
VPPFPQTEEVTACRAASGGLPTSQVVAEDGPRPSRELVPDADTSESRASAQEPARGLAGGLVGAGYWGSSGRTLAAWAPFGPDVTSNSTTWPSASER